MLGVRSLGVFAVRFMVNANCQDRKDFSLHVTASMNMVAANQVKLSNTNAYAPTDDPSDMQRGELQLCLPLSRIIRMICALGCCPSAIRSLKLGSKERKKRRGMAQRSIRVFVIAGSLRPNGVQLPIVVMDMI